MIGAIATHLPAPPVGILEKATLFLDLDGTLLELADRPDEVRADAHICMLLTELEKKLQRRLGIISGRSLNQIDEILGGAATNLALSGSHGCEHRWNGVLARPDRPPSLEAAAVCMRLFANDFPGVLVEEKSFGVALHYRMATAAAPEAHRLAEALSEELELAIQHGKMMIELRVPGGGKGAAIQRLMSRPPMKGTTPVFAGDDITDEDGFATVRELGGHAILIGPPRSTAANFRLPSPFALREWLWRAVR